VGDIGFRSIVVATTTGLDGSGSVSSVLKRFELRSRYNCMYYNWFQYATPSVTGRRDTQLVFENRNCRSQKMDAASSSETHVSLAALLQGS
jgi:hypothetical protein